MILAFDVSGFFDSLDHALLKSRLKRILEVPSLSNDWYQIYRFVTDFHFVDLDDLKAHPAFASKLKQRGSDPIATVAELKTAGIRFQSNPKVGAGIPQGTPISAALSNLYMIDLDVKLRDFCGGTGAFYRRYSDDILIICPIEQADDVEAKVVELIGTEKLALSHDKTERTIFYPTFLSPHGEQSAQYLGFTYYQDGAGIRPSSLSRQWRKMRRSIRRVRKIAAAAIAAGTANQVFTKKLRRKFSPLKFRNFSSYARRGAKAFGTGNKVMNQVRRLEREFERAVRELQDDLKL